MDHRPHVAHHAVSDEALDAIFRNARTQNKWQDKPVSPALLMAVYDLMRWGPTAANSSPARLLFVASQDAKEARTAFFEKRKPVFVGR